MTQRFDYNPKTLTKEKPGRQAMKPIVGFIAGAALMLVLIGGLLVSYLPSAYTSIVSAHRLPQQLPGTISHALARPGSPSSLESGGGKLLWRHKTGDVVWSSPAVVNGVVYIGSDDHYIYAFNASNGSLLWRYKTGAFIISSPVVVKGVVYIGSDDDYVYALNASTGTLLWHYQTGNRVLSSPAVVKGVVYAGSEDDYIYALKAGSGTLLWRYQTGNQIFTSSPAVGNGVVYIGSTDHYVYALTA